MSSANVSQHSLQKADPGRTRNRDSVFCVPQTAGAPKSPEKHWEGQARNRVLTEVYV